MNDDELVRHILAVISRLPPIDLRWSFAELREMRAAVEADGMVPSAILEEMLRRLWHYVPEFAEAFP